MVGRLQHVRYRQVLWTPLVCSDNHSRASAQYLTCATSCSESVHESPTKGEERGALDVSQASRKQRQKMQGAHVLLPALVPPELVIQVERKPAAENPGAWSA